MVLAKAVVAVSVRVPSHGKQSTRVTLLSETERRGGSAKKYNDGKGLYVCHPPGNHDAWLASKKKMKDTGAKFPEYKPPDPLFEASAHTVDNSKTVPAKSTASTLELREEMKQVLATFGMSSSDAEEAWNLAKERASKN